MISMMRVVNINNQPSVHLMAVLRIFNLEAMQTLSTTLIITTLQNNSGFGHAGEYPRVRAANSG